MQDTVEIPNAAARILSRAIKQKMHHKLQLLSCLISIERDTIAQ